MIGSCPSRYPHPQVIRVHSEGQYLGCSVANPDIALLEYQDKLTLINNNYADDAL